MVDHAALFEDVLAVVRSARSATGGWRTICVRARRAVGSREIAAVADLDLDDDVGTLATRVGELVGKAPPEIDTLVFGFDSGVEDGDAGAITLFHVSGLAGFDPSLRWLPQPATWTPEDRYLHSPALDAIARATDPASPTLDTKRAFTNELRFGAAALLARFATQELSHAVLVAFEDGDYAVIRPR